MHRTLVAAIVVLAGSFAASAQNAANPPQKGPNVSNAQTVTADVLKDLAPTGKLRAAINQGNAVLVQKDPAGGEPKGVTIMLAKELGKKLGVPVELVLFNGAGETFEALKRGAWDIGFLAVEPVRAAEIEFTAPYVIIEGVYLVPKDSTLKTPADVDRAGIRIGVNKGSAYDLFLTRTLKNATLVRGENGIALFRNEKLEAAGGVKEPVVAYAKTDASVRVMEQRFMAIEQAMGTPKGRLAGAAYLRGFVEEMKASGFVADALKRTNQTAQVAPPAN
jgi:polar amino acid transport system substrate-binding protein